MVEMGEKRKKQTLPNTYPECFNREPFNIFAQILAKQIQHLQLKMLNFITTQNQNTIYVQLHSFRLHIVVGNLRWNRWVTWNSSVINSIQCHHPTPTPPIPQIKKKNTLHIHNNNHHLQSADHILSLITGACRNGLLWTNEDHDKRWLYISLFLMSNLYLWRRSVDNSILMWK